MRMAPTAAAILLFLLATTFAHAEEECGPYFTCTANAVYGCAPLTNHSNMVCCSDGQQGLKGVDKYCDDTDPTKLPFCPGGGATGAGCVRDNSPPLTITCAPIAKHTTNLPPPSPTAKVSTATTLGLSWTPASTPAALYDVHISLASSPKDPFLSVTSETPDALLLDLLPATSYTLSVRARGPKPANWTSLGPMVTCTTDKADSPTYGLDVLLPPRTVDTHGGFTITLSKPAPSEEAWFAHYRLRGGSSSAWTTVAILPNTTTQSFASLQPSSEYEVYIKSSLPPHHPQSPIVIHRTTSPKTSFFEVYRISELCGNACQPDMLDDHDSGELLADVSFITHVAASSTSHSHHAFNITFNGSIVTRYCVERAVPKADDWADYTSCNGPWTTDYKCECNNWIDRCIGRLDISTCDISHPPRGNMPLCTCTQSSLERSAKEIGRMPVYSPYPSFKGSFNCTETLPPPSKSAYLGHWYSTPSAAACPPGTSPEAGTTCTWSRRPSQHYVRGPDLLALGFNTSNAADTPELEHNSDVIRKAFERHPGRCCGC